MLLVEGVAEAIIIPILAKKFLTEKIDLCKSGIELVNIGGVAFNHFGLLLTMMMRESDYCRNVRSLQTAIPKTMEIYLTERKKQRI